MLRLKHGERKPAKCKTVIALCPKTVISTSASEISAECSMQISMQLIIVTSLCSLCLGVMYRIFSVGTCRASRFDSNSNQPFDSKGIG